MLMNWREYPMVRLLLPLIGGVWTGVVVEAMQQWVVLSALIMLLALLAYWQKGRQPYGQRWWYGMALHLFLFGFGLLLANIQDERRLPRHFSGQGLSEQEGLLMGRIETIGPAGHKLKAKVKIQIVRDDNGHVHCASGSLLAYFDISAATRMLAAGDVALLRARVYPIAAPLNPKAFDYARYMHFQNIHYQAFVAEGEWRLVAHQPGLLSHTARLRAYCIRVLREFLPTENEFAVAAALVLGYKAELSDEVRNAYAHTGAIHVLAVSGLHVGFVQLLAAFLLGFVSFSGRAWPIARTLVILLCIWGFALLTGASPSVLRAASMFSFLAIGQALRRHTNIYNTLAASAFCLLCVNPFLLFSLGFQLSYLAVLGIVYFQPRIYRLWYIENRAGDYLWKLVAVSVAAQITTFPISLFSFHQFPAYFWLSGLVVVPAAALILLGGLALFALHAAPLVGWLLGQLLYRVVWLVNAFIFLIQQLPGSLLQGVWIGALVVVLLYVAIIGIVAAVQRRNFRYLLAAMVALLLVAILQSSRSWQLQQQQVLTVYHVKGNTAIDLFNGRQAIQLLGEEQEREGLLFATQQYRWYRGISELPSLNYFASFQGANWCLSDGFLQFAGLRLAILSDESLLQGTSGRLAVDAVLLCKNVKCSITELKEKLEFGLVIIDGSNSYHRVQDWQEQCQMLDIPCHYTGKDGAWVLSAHQ